MASFMITYANISVRQGASTVGDPLSTSTSSFNWWPYPAGSVTTSTSMLTSTPVLLASTASPDSTTTTSLNPTPLSSYASTTTSAHSSAPSLIQITASMSIPASPTSSDSQSSNNPHPAALNPLWLIPLCILSGAVFGCAVGWFAWRYFGKRDRAGSREFPDGYVWAYQQEREVEMNDKDVERGHGHEYASLGRRSTADARLSAQRMPSKASTSGAQTWLDHPQARKRSGAAGAPRTSVSSAHEYEDAYMVKSPLLAQSFPSDNDLASKPLPVSPLPSSYPYGDEEEGDDIPYEPMRHKSVKRRIWERLGFGEGDNVGKKSKGHEGDGRHTWSAGVKEERGADLGRTLSLWGRRRTIKEGRVERWVRGVMGEDEESSPARAVNEHEETLESLDDDDTPMQHGTPELVLSTLRRVSPTTHHSQGSDDYLTDILGFDGKSSVPYSPTTHQPSPVTDTHTTMTQVEQRRSVQREEQRPRGVSLQDPGPVSKSGSVSRSTAKKHLPTSKNASALRSAPSAHSIHSQRSLSSHTPRTPSSVSRYSATPVLTTLGRSTTRPPTRSTASRDLRSSLTRTTAPSRIARPVSTNTSPSRGSGTPPRTHPSPGRGGHTASHRRPPSELPAGPSLVMSPPLQSALCFDDAPTPLTAPSRTPTASRATGTRPSTSHTDTHSTKRASNSYSTPNDRARATPLRSGYRSTGHTPSPITAPKPFTPKERHLARQNANARVGMILSRSYSSRNFDERPTSPTMFGAMIDEDIEEQHVHDGDSKGHETLTFQPDGVGESIEQRLDILRRQDGSRRR